MPEWRFQPWCWAVPGPGRKPTHVLPRHAARALIALPPLLSWCIPASGDRQSSDQRLLLILDFYRLNDLGYFATTRHFRLYKNGRLLASKQLKKGKAA